MESPRWSNNQLRKLGDRLRTGADRVEDELTYVEVRQFYAQAAMGVQTQIRALDWRFVLGHREVEVTARAKTIDTVRDKLNRDRSTPLSRIQDLAGVRFEAEMSLSQQQAVAETIANRFGAELPKSLHDLRDHPRSGYRAIHIWLVLPHRVEVQVRTHLQSAWANLYEEAGDYFGRKIRYGSIPDGEIEAQVVQGLQRFSLHGLTGLENRRDVLYQRELELKDNAWRVSKGLHPVGATVEEPRFLQKIEDEYVLLRAEEKRILTEMHGLQQQLRRLARARRRAS